MSHDHGVYALLAAGGTGGHLYPAIALADALVARGHDHASIRFVGARGHLEATVVPEAGYAIDLLPGRGLQRRLTLANVVTIWEAIQATIRAIALIRRYRPAVVVGFGSYAALPTVVAARLLRRPTVVHDRDAAPGSRQSHRCTPGRAGGHLAPDHRTEGRDAGRESGARRPPHDRTTPPDPTARRVHGWESGCPDGEPGCPGSL